MDFSRVNRRLEFFATQTASYFRTPPSVIIITTTIFVSRNSRKINRAAGHELFIRPGMDVRTNQTLGSVTVAGETPSVFPSVFVFLSVVYIIRSARVVSSSSFVGRINTAVLATRPYHRRQYVVFRQPDDRCTSLPPTRSFSSRKKHNTARNVKRFVNALAHTLPK